jgi:ADP-ribose pyrophosphatase YjhB (NUDIX family)
MSYIAQRIAMKAAVVDADGRILILKEAESGYKDGTQGGLWGLTGGRVNPGENWLDGLRR